MKIKNLVIGLLVAGFMFGVAMESEACSSAGPNKHVGNVTAVNLDAETFTILDAETGSPISFEATSNILKDLTVEDRVMVSYQENEGKLTAVEIQS